MVFYFNLIVWWLIKRNRTVRIRMQNRILYRNNVSQGFDNVVKVGLIAISFREKQVTSTLQPYREFEEHRPKQRVEG